MVKSFLFAVLTLLTVIGICELIYIAKMFFYFPDVKTYSYCLISLKKGFAVKQLNYFYQKMKWHGDVFAHGIIAITDELDTQELSECNQFIQGKNLFLCTSDCISVRE